VQSFNDPRLQTRCVSQGTLPHFPGQAPPRSVLVSLGFQSLFLEISANGSTRGAIY